MNFKVRYEELSKALSAIKSSKSLSKSSGDENACILIKAEEDKVSFTVTNEIAWTKATILKEDYEDLENPDSLFEVKETGQIFVDSSEFINLITTYSKGSVITFIVTENSSNKIYLETKSVQNKKTKTSKFLSIAIDNFIESPIEESREEIKVDTELFCEAVHSVSFASQNLDDSQYRGVQIEFYGNNDISSFATDRTRMCYYDKIGINRGEVVDKEVVPVSLFLTAAIKSLTNAEDTTIKIGKIYTILEQKNIQHSIPNVIFEEEEKVDWRSIISGLKEKTTSSVSISKDIISNFIKTAISSSCGKYGMKISFNSKKNEVKFSLDSIESDSISKTFHEETNVLEDDSFSGEEIDGEILLPIENIKDIISLYKNDNIVIKIIDCMGKPLQIESENEDFQFVTGVTTED